MKEVDFFSSKHETSHRSIETRRLYTTGTTHATLPFYYSYVSGGVHYASVYNYVIPNQLVEAHYTDGVEVVGPHVGRSEVFSAGRLYDEGVNHFKGFMDKDYQAYLSGN